jgi:copper(I)-binding protein
MRGLVVVVVGMLLGAAAGAQELEAGELRIGHPFALETPPRAMTGAGYLSVTNTGDAPDVLLEVRAGFPRVMMHDTEMSGDVARMVHLQAVEIPPGETVTFEPGGKHVMFMGLEGDPLEVGERIPATLVFERAGEVAVEFVVEARGADDTGAAGMAIDDDADAPAQD